MAKRPTRLVLKWRGRRGLVRAHRDLDPGASYTQADIDRALDAAMQALVPAARNAAKPKDKPTPKVEAKRGD